MVGRQQPIVATAGCAQAGRAASVGNALARYSRAWAGQTITSVPSPRVASDNAAMADVRSTVPWLIDGARSAATPDAVLAEMWARLMDCGVPPWRVSVFVRTLHPDLMGRRLRWEVGKGVDIDETPIEVLPSEMFRTSPVVAIIASGRSLRLRLLATDCPFDFPVLGELKAEGATDYLITPLHFISGERHAVSWTTRAPAGFAESEIAALEAVAVPLSRVAEIWAQRRVATNLLDTYSYCVTNLAASPF